MSDLGLILLVIILVFLITSILFLYATKKKEIDQTTAKGLQAYAPKEKKPYFGIDKFTSGWDEAKKSLPQFILFVILLPLIFLSWLAWMFFGKDKPDDFTKVFPPRHPGGRESGTRNKKYSDLDDKLISLMVAEHLDFEPAFWKMREEYWNRAYPNKPYQNPNMLKPVKLATKKRIDRLLLAKN